MLPKPPKHLKAGGKAWWKAAHAEFSFSPAELAIVRMICEAIDRGDQAREVLDREGLTIEGREGGLRPHPCVAIERDARTTFGRLLQRLNLPRDTPERGPGRPAHGFGWKG